MADMRGLWAAVAANADTAGANVPCRNTKEGAGGERAVLAFMARRGARVGSQSGLIIKQAGKAQPLQVRFSRFRNEFRGACHGSETGRGSVRGYGLVIYAKNQNG